MKVVNVTHELTSIPLGRLGENERTMVIFDVQEWLDEYPGVTIGLYNQLPNESTSYPAVITQPTDGKVTWMVSATELQIVGNGRCELVAVMDDVVVKGAIYKTIVYEALDGAGEAPEEWESWLTEFTRLKGEAETAANTSEAYAIGTKNGTPVESTDPEYHNNSKYYAEQAGSDSADAIAAKIAAEAAQTAAETAQGKAEDAQEAAEDAQTAAEAAHGAAESAQTAAETAQGKAEDAQEAAETAQDAAEAAQTAAETAQGKAEDAQTAAETAQGKAEDAQAAAEAAAAALETLIDDTAGAGDTDKVWSADKLVDEFDLKAPKANPVFTGSVSMGRKAGTNVGTSSFATGYNVESSANYSHAEGSNTKATQFAAHAEGSGTEASGYNSHAEGSSTHATEYQAHAEGNATTASGNASHSEGTHTTATNNHAHAEGYYGEATGIAAHAEGSNTHATGNYSHAEGYKATADGNTAHAEGSETTASGIASHAEGNGTTATGYYSHAEGTGTVANHKSQNVSGEYNVEDASSAISQYRGNYVEIVGNGTASNNKSNARALDWNGNEYLKGDLYVGCNAGSSGGTKVAKITDVPDVTGKADKVSSATNGNLAGLDSNGNLTDSGIKSSDVALIDDTSTANNRVWSAQKTNDLKSAFTATMNLKTPIHFVAGAVSSQDGSEVANDKSARCEYIKVRNGTTILFTPTTELSASGYIAIIRKFNTSKTITGSEPNLGVSDASKVYTANFTGYIRIVVQGVGYPVITDEMLNALNQSIIAYTDLSEYEKQEKEQETLAGVLSNNLSGVSCEVGAIKSADGSDTSSSASVRTNFINVSAGTEIVFKPNADDFPTGYYLDIRKYDTSKEFVTGSGERLGVVLDDHYTYVADTDGYLRFMMSCVNGATITTELLQSLEKCVVYIIDTRDYPSVRDKANTNYLFVSNNKLTYSDQMFRHNLYKIKALNGTTKSGFYDVGGVWRESNNFQTLVVENNDNTIFGFLYSGIVYNSTCAGIVWLNEKQVPQAYDLTAEAFIKHEAKYVANKDYPYVAFCTYTGYSTVLGAVGIVPGSPFEQLSLVITGDSVETLAGGKWCDLLADKLGVASYTNCAVGGTCMSPAYNSSTAISGDTRISAMPETADIVLIGGGTNDWGNNIVLGDLTTLDDTSTFAGAVDSMIRKMNTKYPDAIIVFTSNQFTISPNRHNFDDQTGILNNQGKSAGDYANMMKTVCEYRGIPYIPTYQQCGINYHNYTHWLLEETNASNDTVYMHPNSAGAKLMLRVIENAFRNYIQPVPEFAK